MIDDACQVVNGVAAAPGQSRRRFRGVSVDTRTLKPRNAFFCLVGEHSDGHRFVPEAVRLGAGAVVAERGRIKENWRRLGVPVIGVDDPLTALGDLAAEYRRWFPTRFVAVTGSVGKTTTKELIAAALAARYDVFKSPGNYNTLIGIPLALLARTLRPAHDQRLGVLELGMSTPGEIARLTKIVDPEWGVVTRIGAAHLLQMKSIAAVARAKRELFDHARPALRAFLNADDPYQRRWMARWRRATTTYALERDADFTADAITSEPGGVRFRVNRRHLCRLRLAGEYNVPNALAALAVGRSFRIPWDEMIPRLGRVRPVGDRSRLVRLGGVTIINDCYNANPTSTIAALASLRRRPADGRRIAVLGAMRELGTGSDEWHARVGRLSNGLDWVVTVGSGAGAYRRGIPKTVPQTHCPRVPDAVRLLTKKLVPGDTVLIKASRAEGLDEITSRLSDTLEARSERP
ncbi:MAG TPA: UDP-N-acetylmuramoyl-tripeptide--D-alanyl-D-alanine ligase [Acidobacteriota bacterium]|nr:UDP-N-acetylmuramoyl-tripeptide--D-alanyl-D-alanine ligase [Acidobacteriota bacterium]